jgi:carboxypeptidase C (cathepsin A)
MGTSNTDRAAERSRPALIQVKRGASAYATLEAMIKHGSVASKNAIRRRPLAAAAAAWLAMSGAHARAQPSPQRQPTQAGPADGEQQSPADSTTDHTLELPGRSLHFSATAGSIRLADQSGKAQADIAFVAYQLASMPPAKRPVTFVFNGGPGHASAWLHVGAVGPWRIPIAGAASVPSGSPEATPNADTWLDFTDLVFIDPAGTGYSRILASEEDARRRFWSVDGDIQSLAEIIRRWLDRNDRILSPKYILGESYGGFRAPRLAHELQLKQGVGVSGVVMVSPALDFGGRSRAFDPLYYATRLPSMVAAARAARGQDVTRESLADVEHYASGEYLLDLVRGESDADAVVRRSQRVAALTGLDPALVGRHHGVIGIDLFLHELFRQQRRVASGYDATVTSADPFPLDDMSDYPDPILEGLAAPVSSAMLALYEGVLNWRPSWTYHLSNKTAFEQWNWGRKLVRPESVTELRQAMALDPRMRVLVTHGFYDLLTPYFGSVMLLDQLPVSERAEQVRLAVYSGGHMFYARDQSRDTFRADAMRVFEVR